MLLAIAASIPSAIQLNAAAAPATEFRATVLSIGDGDTLRVSRQGLPITIRLACIDAPEMAQSPYWQESRSDLQSRLAKGCEVTILPHTIDRYGRTVAEVISDLNINLVLVEDGQAFAYRQYLGGCEAKEYLDAEYRASRHHPSLGFPPGTPQPCDLRWHHPRRPPLPLQRDRLLCQGSGVVAAGTQLPRQQW